MEILPEERTKELLEIVLEVESFVLRLEKKGITFREFISARNENGNFPRFQIEMLNGTRFAYSNDEFVALRKEDAEAQKLSHEQTLHRSRPKRSRRRCAFSIRNDSISLSFLKKITLPT